MVEEEIESGEVEVAEAEAEECVGEMKGRRGSAGSRRNMLEGIQAEVR